MADVRKLEEDGDGVENSRASLPQTNTGAAMTEPQQLEEGEEGAETSPPAPQQTDCSHKGFHSILHSVGGFGKWQWKVFFLGSFCGSFTAFHNLAAGKCMVKRTVSNFGYERLFTDVYAKYQ